MSKAKAMTKEEIQDAIQQYVSDATTYLDSELSPARATMTEYYQGKKFGNEEQGRSQYVSTDVRDTVLAMMPSLVRLFLPTSGHVFEYQARPKALGDVQQAVLYAEQATEFVNGPVLDQDNDGFSEIFAAFKNGLVQEAGWIKWWWEDTSTYQDYTAQRLDVTQLESLLADPDVEVRKQAVMEQGGVKFYTVDYRHWRYEGVARIACVPPEEILVSRDARNLRDAQYVAHRTEKTRSQLIEMGVPAKEIDEYGGASSEIAQSIEETARRGGISHQDQVPDPALQKHLWVESYVYLPLDGERADLVRITSIGPGAHVVGEPEPIARRPLCFLCPDPEPHVLFGGGVSRRVSDLQLMKSSVARAGADSLSRSLFPRRYYMEGVVDQQAMQSTAMGQDIAVRDGVLPAQAVLIETVEPTMDQALGMIGYLDTVKQQRVGPLPATLDPDSLQSTPEVGVKATVQAASEQLELIARVFANQLKELGKGLLQLLVDNQPRARIARLRGQYVEVDPRAWDAEMDVSVHVALGTEQKLGILAATAADQFQILSTLGPNNPACGLGQYLHTRKTMLQLQGIQDTTKFYNDLPVDWQPPPQPQAPDPNQLIAQAEMVKAQAQIEKQRLELERDKVQLQQDRTKMEAEFSAKIADMGLEREKMHLENDLKRDQLEAEIALKAAEINAKYGAQLDVAKLDAQIRQETSQRDAETTLEAARIKGNGQPKKKKMTISRAGGQTTVESE